MLKQFRRYYSCKGFCSKFEILSRNSVWIMWGFGPVTGKVVRAISTLLLSTALAGCGTSISKTLNPQPAPVPLDIHFTGTYVVKARSGPAGVVALEEHPVSIFREPPVRRLSTVSNAGVQTTIYTPPQGWFLLDFAQHPSGDISLVLSTATTLKLFRLDAKGVVRFEMPLTDDAAALDPLLGGNGPHNDNSLQPVLMHDAARLAPMGEDLGIVIRTGRNAVVAYRYRLGTGIYTLSWRTLVEPGTYLFGIFLINGSFDTMNQLDNHVRVFMDVNAEGNMAIAVVGDQGINSGAFSAHAEYFHEPVSAIAGGLVTRLAPNGLRLGTTVVDTQQISEIHGLRATGSEFTLVGRVLTERRADGTGWDAWLAMVNSSDGTLRQYRVLDIDRGDVLFDVALLSGGRLLVGGTTGYIQNPSGASISEDAQPLLAILDSDGRLISRLSYPQGPRHNQLLSLNTNQVGLFAAGMENGPGTHSNDSAPDQIAADGYIRQLSEPLL